MQERVILMTGEYTHSLDNKGRVFIPAKMRDELGDVVYITVSTESCLNGYNTEKWELLNEKVNSLPVTKQKLMRPIFANAVRCELDSQGRVLIPAALRKYAGIEKNVTVVGCGNHCEFWNSETWSSVCKKEFSPDNIAAVMEELKF